MTDLKKQTAEELAEKYSIAPLSRQDKDSVIRFKGDNLKITQEIQRLAFLAGFKARDEEVKQLLARVEMLEKALNSALVSLGGHRLYDSEDIILKALSASGGKLQ